MHFGQIYAANSHCSMEGRVKGQLLQSRSFRHQQAKQGWWVGFRCMLIANVIARWRNKWFVENITNSERQKYFKTGQPSQHGRWNLAAALHIYNLAFWFFIYLYTHTVDQNQLNFSVFLTHRRLYFQVHFEECPAEKASAWIQLHTHTHKTFPGKTTNEWYSDPQNIGQNKTTIMALDNWPYWLKVVLLSTLT